ncbi:hypothetical protein EVA_00515 [gut metagenome]|uniref:Uncharacterized protein n=1 Tax=gut metagenome TaxID=749906 RepID=J9H434_9ZZZZ
MKSTAPRIQPSSHANSFYPKANPIMHSGETSETKLREGVISQERSLIKSVTTFVKVKPRCLYFLKIRLMKGKL